MIELFHLLLHVVTMSRSAGPGAGGHLRTAARLIHREQSKKFQWKNSFFGAVVVWTTAAVLDTAKEKLQICKPSMDETPEPQKAGKMFE